MACGRESMRAKVKRTDLKKAADEEAKMLAEAKACLPPTVDEDLRKKTEKTRDSVIRALQENPNDRRALRALLGDVLKLLKKDPNNVELWVDAGMLSEQLKDYGGAVKAFEMASRLRLGDEKLERMLKDARANLERQRKAAEISRAYH